MDAPSHFSEGGWRIGEVPFERLMGPGVLIDIQERAKLVYGSAVVLCHTDLVA